MDTSIICHPDKVEIYFSNTPENLTILSRRFHDMARLWTSRWGLQWEDLPKRYDERFVWKSWGIKGVNDHVGIFVQGPAYHIPETSPMTRLFKEPHWMLGHPFPDPSQAEIYRHHRHIGLLRITDRRKTDPAVYTSHIVALLRDIQDIGAVDFPRKLEIAMDCSDPDLARDLRLTVRLRRSNPLGLVHFLPGLQGKRWTFYGPGANHGDREYEIFRGYVIDKVRQLAVYPRWDNGFYRIELRLAQRSLRRYFRSEAFLTARDPKIASSTLAVLDTIPTILREHLIRECLDIASLCADHPRTKSLGLDGLSIRGQRFLLLQAGLSLAEISRYSVRLPMPPMTILTPDTVTGLVKGTVDQQSQVITDSQ